MGDDLFLYDETLRKAVLVMIYGMLETSVDITNQEVQAHARQGQSLYIRLNTASSYINPKLMSIGFGTHRKWTQQDDHLAHMGHFIR